MDSCDVFEGTVIWKFQNSELPLPPSVISVSLQVLEVTAYVHMHAHAQIHTHRYACPVYLLSSICVVIAGIEGNSFVFKLKLYDVYWQESRVFACIQMLDSVSTTLVQ